jgi:hypothetical protein
MAQAAAVVLAVGVLLGRQGATRPVETVPASIPGQDVVFNVEPGTTLFLELNETDGRLVCTPRQISTDDLVTFDSEGVPPSDIAGLADLLLINGTEGLE